MDDPSLGCLVLLANLCVHSAISIDFEDSGLTGSASIHEQSSKIVVVLHSDDIQRPDWSKMSNACVDGFCISYYKFCSQKESGDGFSCDYYFSQLGDAENREVTISANNDGQVHDAEAVLGAVAHAGGRVKEIPFSGFRVEGKEDQPPHCNHREPKSACWGGRKPDQ